mmetsp:Transcript_126410/g.404745  ORF Transcript_126410/g.404745 Transcript_126410/m.404745 type:complete len:330 (-) Transcript_126410:469-1458(-)
MQCSETDDERSESGTCIMSDRFKRRAKFSRKHPAVPTLSGRLHPTSGQQPVRPAERIVAVQVDAHTQGLAMVCMTTASTELLLERVAAWRGTKRLQLIHMHRRCTNRRRIRGGLVAVGGAKANGCRDCHVEAETHLEVEAQTWLVPGHLRERKARKVGYAPAVVRVNNFGLKQPVHLSLVEVVEGDGWKSTVHEHLRWKCQVWIFCIQVRVILHLISQISNTLGYTKIARPIPGVARPAPRYLRCKAGHEASTDAKTSATDGHSWAPLARKEPMQSRADMIRPTDIVSGCGISSAQNMRQESGRVNVGVVVDEEIPSGPREAIMQHLHH